MNEHDPIATPLAALLAEHAGNVVLPHGSLGWWQAAWRA